MAIAKNISINLNNKTGNGVFSGPKGHILLVKDLKKNIWERVAFTQDNDFAQKFVADTDV